MLFISSLLIGFTHTILGPDHYIPFIVIGRARRWGLFKTSLLTFFCGLGHVLSSVLLGLVGVGLGLALGSLEEYESFRGDMAAWSLILFGAGYAAWGIWRAKRGRSHSHPHLHKDGTLHEHGHAHPKGDEIPHEHNHALSNDEKASWKSLTPWILFIIFVLGPCEPLIPLFFASAVSGDWLEVAMVALGYTAATVLTMNIIVAAFWYGLKQVNFGPLERWSHALAGALVFLSGAGIAFLGL